MPSASPARRRLGRIRWSITAGFALTTALGLGALALVTLRLDDDARYRDVVADLQRQVPALERTVTVEEDGSLDLTAFERRIEIDPPERWAVLSDGLLLVAGPDQRAVPADAALRRIVADARFTGTPPVFQEDDATGAPRSWAALAVAPGPGLDPAPGSVVLVGESLGRDRQHAALERELLVAVAALTFLTAAAGHLISGRAMRPAITGLDQQEQFLTEAAHELRTPIATLQLLLDADEPGADDRAAERRQVARLERLLESLLLRARADASGAPPALTPLRLDQLVERTVGELAPPDVRLELEPVIVRGAPQVLALAVRNLVENAERHGGGPVRVVVGPDGLTVEDHGPGIAAPRRQAVLRRGVSDDGGTGSGLALVAWAAEVHRAGLTLSDTEGGGLTVRLRLAISSPPHGGGGTLDP